MRDNPETTAVLRALIARGVRIALDDFGTGYSALAYLARLPHHRIKLDKAFVQDLANPATADLIRAIIAMARAQGVAVTAEGVERPEQLPLVRRVGFTHAQGYATGLPVADPDALLRRAGRRPGRAARPRLEARLSPARTIAARVRPSARGSPMRALSQSPRDPAFVQDPYPFYDRARALGPLFLWEDYGFPCAAGHAAVDALLRDRRFGRELPADLKPARPAHLADFYALDDRSMLDREPPAHTRLRGLVLRAFTSRRIAALGPEIAALANALIDRLDGAGVRPAAGLRRAAAGRRHRPAARRARGRRRRPARLVARHGRDVPGPPRPRRRGRAPTPPPATSPPSSRDHVDARGAAARPTT